MFMQSTAECSKGKFLSLGKVQMKNREIYLQGFCLFLIWNLFAFCLGGKNLLENQCVLFDLYSTSL